MEIGAMMLLEALQLNCCFNVTHRSLHIAGTEHPKSTVEIVRVLFLKLRANSVVNINFVQSYHMLGEVIVMGSYQ